MAGPIRLTLAHSPDPDDAFMWWPLGTPDAPPAIDTGPFAFELVAEDIQTLNTRAIERGDLDVTAISMHAYAHVSERYAITRCGASMGDGYGPRIVARDARDRAWLDEPGRTFAVPGLQTSAYLTLSMMLGRAPEVVAMPFEEIPGAVLEGSVDAGVVIHQSQLTYKDEGLHLIADLGAWWTDETGLPLPLGANAVRRDLDERFGPGTLARLSGVLSASVAHALREREHGVTYALNFAPGLDAAIADRFIGMYVNELTQDLGERGERAVELFLKRGADAGLVPSGVELVIV